MSVDLPGDASLGSVPEQQRDHVARRRDVSGFGIVSVCVYYCRTFYKAVRVGEEESGGHVL